MTTDRTDHVLAAIDGALADYELGDAMRWSPAPEEVTGAPPARYTEDPWPYTGGERTRLWVDEPGDPLAEIPDHRVAVPSAHGIWQMSCGSEIATVDAADAFARAHLHWELHGRRGLPDAVAVEAARVHLHLEGYREAWSEMRDRLLAAIPEEIRRLVDTGPDAAPVDRRAAALEARRNRNTGPARPNAQQARRPRRHQ